MDSKFEIKGTDKVIRNLQKLSDDPSLITKGLEGKTTEMEVDAACDSCGLAQRAAMEVIINQIQGERIEFTPIAINAICTDCGGALCLVYDRTVTVICDSCGNSQDIVTPVKMKGAEQVPIWGSIALLCDSCGQPIETE